MSIPQSGYYCKKHHQWLRPKAVKLTMKIFAEKNGKTHVCFTLHQGRWVKCVELETRIISGEKPKKTFSERYNSWMKKLNTWGFPCPVCKKLTRFREDENPEFFVCLECGYLREKKTNSKRY